MARLVLNTVAVKAIKNTPPSSLPNGTSIRIGFIPVTDCAPLIAAEKLGLFESHGLKVSLHCEAGWATIREKMVHGQLEAAHAVAGLILALRLGLQGPSFPVVSPFIFSLQGNAITLSRDLWNRGVRDAGSLKKLIRSQKDRLFTFGVVSTFSAHYFLMRRWLERGGINPETDVRILAFPPSLMAENLGEGLLDGFCAGEPWNSQAVADRTGWCPAVSAELMPQHPEKVLLVAERFANEHADQLRTLCEVFVASCAFCDAAENRAQLAKWLAESGYFTATANVLSRSLVGPFDNGMGQLSETESFHIFSRYEANIPTAGKSAWLLQECKQHGLISADRMGQAETELSIAWRPLNPAAPAIRKTSKRNPKAQLTTA